MEGHSSPFQESLKKYRSSVFALCDVGQNFYTRKWLILPHRGQSVNLRLSSLLIARCHISHNIIKHCAFVPVGLENITMECPKLVQSRRFKLSLKMHWVGAPRAYTLSWPTWTNAHCLIMLRSHGQPIMPLYHHTKPHPLTLYTRSKWYHPSTSTSPSKVCGCYWVVFLNRTRSIFDWYVVWWGPKNKHHNGACLKEIGLHL